jgi:hypothetical protein
VAPDRGQVQRVKAPLGPGEASAEGLAASPAEGRGRLGLTPTGVQKPPLSPATS